MAESWFFFSRNIRAHVRKIEGNASLEFAPVPEGPLAVLLVLPASREITARVIFAQ